MLLVIRQTKLSGRKLKRTVRQRLGPFIDFWSRQMEEESAVDQAAAEAVASAMLSAADIFARSWHAKRLSRREAETLCTEFVLEGVHAALNSSRCRRGHAGD